MYAHMLYIYAVISSIQAIQYWVATHLEIKKSFWWKSQGIVKEIHEKLSKSGENKMVLQMSFKMLTLHVLFQYFVKGYIGVINVTFRYLSDKLESGKNIVSQWKWKL